MYVFLNHTDDNVDVIEAGPNKIFSLFDLGNLYSLLRLSVEEEQEFIMEYMRWVNGGGEVHPGEFDIYNFGFEGQLPGPSIALSPGSDFTEIKEIYPGCAFIGRAPTIQRSHWSRASFIVMLRQFSCAIKNQLKAPKAPY